MLANHLGQPSVTRVTDLLGALVCLQRYGVFVVGTIAAELLLAAFALCLASEHREGADTQFAVSLCLNTGLLGIVSVSGVVGTVAVASGSTLRFAFVVHHLQVIENMRLHLGFALGVTVDAISGHCTKLRRIPVHKHTHFHIGLSVTDGAHARLCGRPFPGLDVEVLSGSLDGGPVDRWRYLHLVWIEVLCIHCLHLFHNCCHPALLFLRARTADNERFLRRHDLERVLEQGATVVFRIGQ
mmetsp:Transcript_22279/g.44206  ORF Transcript_22279/g.44206 Transcript_22279/m.44206 type:complete len:241 (+) Transcript_22279:288-1010(+)